MMSIQSYLEKIITAIYGRDVRKAIHDAIKTTYDDASKDGNANMEVSMARGKYDTLNDRLEGFDYDISLKANQSFVDAQFASIVSGAPKGTFNSLAALKNAYPNGTDGVFLVLENGHWYYWNSVTKQWTDGGLYQAEKIKENSITYNELKNPFAQMMHPNEIEVNFKTKTIKTLNPNSLWVFRDSSAVNYSKGYNQTIDISAFGSSQDYTVYRIYIDLVDNNLLKVAPINQDIGSNVTLGYFYQTEAYGNERGIRVIDTDGHSVNRYKFDNGVLDPRVLMNQLAHIIVKDSVVIDFQNKRVNFNDTLYVIINNYFITKSAPPSVPFPSNYDFASTTYKVYLDLNDNTIKIDTIGTNTTDNPILCFFYRENIICDSYHAIYGIDRNGSRIFPTQKPIETDEIAKAYVDLLHKDTLEINYKTRKIRVINSTGLYVWRTSGFTKLVDAGTEVDFSHLDLSSTDFAGYYVYIDRDAGNVLSVGNAKDVPTQSYVLAKIYQSRVQGNELGIRVINDRGEAINRFEIYQGMDHGYLYAKNAIDIRTSEKKIVWSKISNVVVSTNGAFHLALDGELDYSGDGSPESFVRVLYYDTSTLSLKVKLFNARSTNNSNCIFICLFWGSGSNVAIKTLFENEKQLKINGLTYEERLTSNDQEVDWSSNRFLLPNELYLLKGVDYSMNVQAFNYENIGEVDDIKFELITPTQAQTFEDSMSFSSPFEANLQTRVAGIYQGKRENALFKNVILRFADHQKAAAKSPKVLMIGDSITDALLPAYVYWWLKIFGLNPTMIGTRNNINGRYGLGLVDGLDTTISKGEGRGGWRLTDFTGTTKRADGTIFRSDSPFLNPNNNYAFDFNYYMNNNGFDGVDYVVFMLLTNDITGYHYLKTQENIGTPTMDEILAYMPTEYQKMIDSIHAYDPNIKIGINPPPLAGWGNDSFNSKVKDVTENLQHIFDGTQNNVFCLANYLGNGPISGKTHTDESMLIPVSNINNTKRGTVSNDVHDAQTNTMTSAFWTSSWIINREASVL